jgi:hypothetical protein
LASAKRAAANHIVCKFQVSTELELCGTLQEQAAESLDAFLDRAVPLIRKNASLLVTWPGVGMWLPGSGIPPAVVPKLDSYLREWHRKKIETYNDALAKQKQTENPENIALQSFFKSCPVADVPAAGCRWPNNGMEYYVPGSFWDTLYVKDKPVFGFYAIDLERDALVFIEQLKHAGYVPHDLSGNEISLLTSYVSSLRLTR